MKSVDEALSTADELKELIDKGMNKRAIRIYYDLMGRIEFERNRFSEAVEFFKKAVSQLQVGFYKHAYFTKAFSAISRDSLLSDHKGHNDSY